MRVPKAVNPAPVEKPEAAGHISIQADVAPEGPQSAVSGWDHAAIVLAGVLAIVFGPLDWHTGSLLTQAGDAALTLAGFAVLGVKGTTNLLPTVR